MIKLRADAGSNRGNTTDIVQTCITMLPLQEIITTTTHGFSDAAIQWSTPKSKDDGRTNTAKQSTPNVFQEAEINFQNLPQEK